MSLERILIVAGVVAVMLLMGTMDYTDEVIAETVYINDFCAGIHPDYLELDPDCDQARKLGETNDR